MSCQTNNNRLASAATLSGIPKNRSTALAVVGAAGAAWSGLNLLGQLNTLRRSGAAPSTLGWAAVSAVGLVTNAYVTISFIRDLQARKKVFTRYVVVDRAGAEIGWSYDPGAARQARRAFHHRGARLIPVQVKVDYAEVQNFLRTTGFQAIAPAEV